MTATPGASPTPDPPLQPLQYLGGQPISAETALQRMQELREDTKFMERVAARDAEAFAEHTRLWRVAHGLSVEPTPPHSPVDIGTEADARVIAAVQEHAGFYRDRGYTEQQQIEIVGGRPITMEERRWHEAQYNMKRSSAEFMRRWSAGDLEAIREMNNHAIGMRGLPLGTLEDIKRWEGS
jgi:hypothetical protein